MSNPRTLGELKRAGLEAPSRSVKEEMRQNLLAKLRAGETLFPGVLGYDETGGAPGGQRDPLAPQHDPARAARPGQEPAPAQPHHPARPRDPGGGRLRDPRRPLPAPLAVGEGPARASGRRDPDRLAHPAGSLRGEAGHSRRDHRRHHRRRRSDPRRPRRPRPGQRADHALRPPAPRPPRDLRPERAARPGRPHPGGPLQHPSGRRRADQGLPGAPAHRRCAWSSPPTPRTTRPAARSSPP